MLKTIPFDTSYFNHYNALRCHHDLPEVALSSIPALGVVVEDDFIPVAYAFIRRVEGGSGQLDGLIVNPDFHGEVRDQALDLAIRSAMLEAKVLGITSLMAFCMSSAPIQRAIKLGYVQLSHAILAFDLSKEV